MYDQQEKLVEDGKNIVIERRKTGYFIQQSRQQQESIAWVVAMLIASNVAYKISTLVVALSLCFVSSAENNLQRSRDGHFRRFVCMCRSRSIQIGY